jgi:hypothetical protein
MVALLFDPYPFQLTVARRVGAGIKDQRVTMSAAMIATTRVIFMVLIKV